MLFSIAMIFLSGILLGNLCQRLKIPALTGMLLAGVLLGPRAANLLDPSILSISTELREIALIIILLRAGLSLDIKDLRKIGRPAILMSFVPACFEMAATFLLAPFLFGINTMQAALMAAVIASASPAVIVPRMIKLIDEGYGTDKSIPQMILAGDSVDDVFNIVVFSALLSLAQGEEISLNALFTIPISLISGIAAGLLAGWALAFLFRRAKIAPLTKLLSTLCVCLLMVVAEEHAPFAFSGLLAVMVLGCVLLKSTPVAAGELSRLSGRLWVPAQILLFVLVGAVVPVGYAMEAGLGAIVLLVGILAVRGLGILLCLMRTTLTMRERLFCVLTGIPKATVQAAIGGIPLALGLPGGEIILSVAVVAILVTAPVGALLLDRSYKKLLNF